MKLRTEEKEKLIRLTETASNLLVNIIEETLPSIKQPTKKDIEFNQILNQIYPISPLLSDSYVDMYNNIQKEKMDSQDTYYKKLRKDI